MYCKEKQAAQWNKRVQKERRPEFRMPEDVIADNDRQLRQRLEALRPHSDLKHWR